MRVLPSYRNQSIDLNSKLVSANSFYMWATTALNGLRNTDFCVRCFTKTKAIQRGLKKVLKWVMQTFNCSLIFLNKACRKLTKKTKGGH